MGKLFNQRNAQVGRNSITVDSITLGTVIDSNDPHQMGRLKVLCPTLGDDQDDLNGTALPWATYVSPLGGMVNSSYKRGPGEGASSNGPVAYGIWGIPKRGTTVLVCCIDGDPYYRVWMGCVFDQGAASSLPHGRYFYGGHGGTPEGPFDSYEDPIEPISTNLQQAFKSKSGNFEWRTRGADYSAAGNPSAFTDLSPSDTPDETQATNFTSEDGKTFSVQNGYAANRNDEIEGNDSSVYSWTSPGFHSISMDDRPENCRIRIRTSAGAQLLMDDTNERIYISTAQGNNWVEMDYNGNIDMYGKHFSVRAEKDINFTAGDTIRMFAKNGIHAVSDAEINMEAKKDMNVKVGGSIHASASAKVNIASGTDINIKAGANTQIDSSAKTNLKAGASILSTAPKVLVNASPAAPAEKATPKPAKWTNRLPDHEPYARVMTKDDFTHEPEFTYTHTNVGLMERGIKIPRGKYWRR